MSQDPRRRLNAARTAWVAGRYRPALAAFEQAAAAGEPGAVVAYAKALAALGELTAARRTVAGRRGAGEQLLAALFSLGTVSGEAVRDALHAVPEGGGTAALRRRALAQLERLLDAPAPGSGQVSAASGAGGDGFDWLLSQGLRLDRIHPIAAGVLEAGLAAAPARGLVLEFGVYWGRSIRLLAGWTGRAIHGFDSFRGLPEAWSEREGPGSYSTGGRLPDVPPNVTLHAGWFHETLPRFLAERPDPVAFLHIDCDLYSSTRTVLDALAPRLRRGAVLVFDDFLGYPGWQAHEFRAFGEAAAQHGWRWELLAHAFLGREVALRLR